MMESALIFLVSLLTLRTNLGLLSAQDLTRLEMVTLLCMGDKTRSLLEENMPEKCGNGIPADDFEHILSEVGQYREPAFEAGGNMQQGMYVPQPEVVYCQISTEYIVLLVISSKLFSRLNIFTFFDIQNLLEGKKSRVADGLDSLNDRIRI